MKSKLLLSLGLVAILGMAQASEGTPEVRNIMEMFARLSPADQALVRTGILSQEHVPAIEDTTVHQDANETRASEIRRWLDETLSEENIKKHKVVPGAPLSIDFGERKARISKQYDSTYGDPYYTPIGAIEGRDEREVVEIMSVISESNLPPVKYLEVGVRAENVADRPQLSDEIAQGIIDMYERMDFSVMKRIEMCDHLSDKKQELFERALLGVASDRLESMVFYSLSDKAIAEIVRQKSSGKGFSRLKEIIILGRGDDLSDDVRMRAAQNAGIIVNGDLKYVHDSGLYSRSMDGTLTDEDMAFMSKERLIREELSMTALGWRKRNGQED